MRLAIFISKFLCIFSIMLLGSAAVFAQSSSDLRNKYGAPWEAYEIRQNIWMNVIFGADNQACEMGIEALHTSKNGFNGNRLITLSTAEEILKEVVPTEKRGKGGQHITFSGGCTSIRSEEYENVSIYITELCLQGGGKAIQAIKIKWRHRECQSKA